MRVDLPCDLLSADTDGIVVAQRRDAVRPERVRVGAVISAGVATLWSWVLVRDVAGDLVFAEVLNGPKGVPSHTPPGHVDAAAAAEIEARFWALGGRFHPLDVAVIHREAAQLPAEGVAVLADPDDELSAVPNRELLAGGDDTALWELCQRLVDTHTISEMR